MAMSKRVRESLWLFIAVVVYALAVAEADDAGDKQDVLVPTIGLARASEDGKRCEVIFGHLDSHQSSSRPSQTTEIASVRVTTIGGKVFKLEEVAKAIGTKFTPVVVVQRHPVTRADGEVVEVSERSDERVLAMFKSDTLIVSIPFTIAAQENDPSHNLRGEESDIDGSSD
jgi:hypothetical protein